MSFNNFNIFKMHLQWSHKADSDLELSNQPTLEESRVDIFSVLPLFENCLELSLEESRVEIFSIWAFFENCLEH